MSVNKKKIISKLTQIFDLELSGVIRYTHYSLMIFGANRLPLVDFFKGQANESLAHANLAGEHITGLGGHPPLNINEIKETFKHDISEILKETLEHEKKAIKNYYELLSLINGNSVYLEEYARSMIGQEELHSMEVEKMLKNN
ncbi:MAG: bacterioferritin [Betaproteobacteria bacterium TMED41]|nr:MAG: bacterioferritin [Betaproteobacteria bacterium TMED41]